ncbi:hypothetical protein [Nostoc sp. DSM 114160]
MTTNFFTPDPGFGYAHAKRDNLGRRQAALYINKCICNTGLVLA